MVIQDNKVILVSKDQRVQQDLLGQLVIQVNKEQPEQLVIQVRKDQQDNKVQPDSKDQRVQ